MPLTARERQMLERAESRGASINWVALNRRFNLTCSPIITHGVSINVLVELAELTTKLIEKTGKSLTLSGIVLFPTICDPAIYARSDRLTHKRKDNAYFVVRGIDFEGWKRARHLKRLVLAIENYESSLAWIPERHLPADDRALLVGTLRKAAAHIKSRHAAAARRRAAARGERHMYMKSLWIMLLFVALAHGPTAWSQSAIAERITGDAVNTNNQSKGVLLLAVRWNRRWNCAGFENAQLRVIGFDKLPAAKADDATPDLVLDDAPLVMTKPVFENYAFHVEPGEYGLSRLEIKVAKSRSHVGSFKVPRSKFTNDGKSLGGTFTVGAGEAVYLGHFYLDCHQQPILWRYYPEGRDGFNGYLSSLKKIYPALDVEKVVFRLFQTKEFGQDYKLP